MGNANGTGMLHVGAMIGVELANNGPQVGGGQLQGKAYLQVDKEKVSASSLVLRFLGLEKVSVNCGEHGSTVHADHDIVRIEATLAQFPSGEVTKGRHEFPFVLNIPPNLPGTQGQVEGLDYFAIQYAIGAELIRPASMLNAKVANYTEIFIMDAPAIGPPVPSTVRPHIVPVSFCCCYSTGQMQLTANVDSTCPAMGESFNVSFGMENMSSSKVKGVEVMLKQMISGNVKEHSFRSTSELFKDFVPSTEVPGSEEKRGGQSYQSVAVQPSASTLKTVVANVPLCRPTLGGVNGGVSHMLIVKRPADWQAQNMPMAERESSWFHWRRKLPISLVPRLLWQLLRQCQVWMFSVQYLIQQLQSANQFLEVSVVRDWLAQGGRVDDFTPDMLQQVFGCLRQEMSYSSLTEDVGAAMRGNLLLYQGRLGAVRRASVARWCASGSQSMCRTSHLPAAFSAARG
eukprot:gene32761-39602_t